MINTNVILICFLQSFVQFYLIANNIIAINRLLQEQNKSTGKQLVKLEKFFKQSVNCQCEELILVFKVVVFNLIGFCTFLFYTINFVINYY